MQVIEEYNRILKPQRKETIVFLSTYPPRECGIATFTQDLRYFSQKFLGERIDYKVAALNLTPLDTYKYPPEVEWEIDQNDKKDHLELAKIINNQRKISGVIIQHEYGIFGGKQGESILYFMRECRKPMLVTLHTVLPFPTVKMKSVTSEIVRLAGAIVVLTKNSQEIMEHVYPDAVGKVSVIPHGIHPVVFAKSNRHKTRLELKNHIILSTFGLLSRGKGIEYAIKALPKVIQKYPTVLYLILGETHPVVRRREGEKYRLELSRLVKKLGLEEHVKFYDQYLGLPDLFEFLKATDIYIATSTNPNQAVSGTLSYALGSGRAVISTEFAQAKEILTSETGRLVPIKDSAALTAAILDLLSNPHRLQQMHREAYERTRPMLWSTVAKRYTDLLASMVLPDLDLSHLQKMTDNFGLFQFASLSIPNKKFGYTADDNARALVLCSWLIRQKKTKEVMRYIRIYFSFLKYCQQPDGSFINYIDHAERAPTVQNKVENLEDTQARVIWALSEVMHNPFLSKTLRKEAKEVFLKALPIISRLSHLRAKAFAIKALAQAVPALPSRREELKKCIQEYADSLIQALKNNSQKSWTWFEPHLTYNNAVLPESLLIAASITKNPVYQQKGVLSLRFLIGKTFSAQMYRPIGHGKWYVNKQTRSHYDQQPEDPAAMILALVTAYKTTHNEEYKNLAKICFSWFLGNNTIHIPLYDPKTGGCYDGLQPKRVNLNQGAESLISYLMARSSLSQL